MITLPTDLKALRGLPGYFYRESDGSLFSIKIGGVLKPLKHRVCPPMHWNHLEGFSGWELSVNGRRRLISDSKIKSLIIQEDFQIPYI